MWIALSEPTGIGALSGFLLGFFLGFLRGCDSRSSGLRLGHESVETTQGYQTASLALKEKILAKTTPHAGRPGCYRPDDKLLGFLNSL